MGFLLLLLLVLVVAVLAAGAWVVVAIVSAVLYALFAIGDGLLPVLMILAGVWLVWRAVADNRRHRRRAAERPSGRAGHPGHAPSPSPGRDDRQRPVGARAVRRDHGSGRGAPLTTTTATPPPPRRELPIDVQVKVEQIRRKSDVLLSYADRFPPFSQSLHIVRQTAVDYLPRTVEAYLALPGLSDPVVPATGRTALTELRAQLHVLDAKLDDITLDLQQQDLDKMSANRRFLEERFGPGGTTDSVPPVAASPVANQR